MAATRSKDQALASPGAIFNACRAALDSGRCTPHDERAFDLLALGITGRILRHCAPEWEHGIAALKHELTRDEMRRLSDRLAEASDRVGQAAADYAFAALTTAATLQCSVMIYALLLWRELPGGLPVWIGMTAWALLPLILFVSRGSFVSAGAWLHARAVERRIRKASITVAG